MILETERVILREFQPDDGANLFSLDSVPEVHTYLGNKPLTDLKQADDVVQFIIKQYEDFGIARWAAIEKATGKFMGWSGLKYLNEPMAGLHKVHDLGYRFKPEFWGKGFATETAKAGLAYAYDQLNVDVVYGMTHHENLASARVLEKVGFSKTGHFDYDGTPCFMFEARR